MPMVEYNEDQVEVAEHELVVEENQLRIFFRYKDGNVRCFIRLVTDEEIEALDGLRGMIFVHPDSLKTTPE